MYYLSIFTALLAGALMPLQGAINARLGHYLNHPIQATLISFLVGALFCGVYVAIISAPFPSLKSFTQIDWRLYSGGLLGVFFVTVMLTLIPKIGFANVVGSIIVGQLLVSIVFDHYGFFGNKVIEINPTRIIGVALLLAGLYFIQIRK